MGFSLQFYRLKNGEPIDGNREKFAQFLQEKGLVVNQNKLLENNNGECLTLDGYFTDLYISQKGELSASLDHATLSDQECAFIYEMSLAADWFIINPQGDPTFLIPNNNHQLNDIPEELEEDTLCIQNAQQLQFALSEGFGAFQDYLHRIKEHT